MAEGLNSAHQEEAMDTIKLKNIKLSKDEQEFIKNYRRMEDLEREKGIKFFQCIGDEPITNYTRDEIKKYRVETIVLLPQLLT
jgi:hypothetical protein